MHQLERCIIQRASKLTWTILFCIFSFGTPRPVTGPIWSFWISTSTLHFAAVLTRILAKGQTHITETPRFRTVTFSACPCSFLFLFFSLSLFRVFGACWGNCCGSMTTCWGNSCGTMTACWGNCCSTVSLSLSVTACWGNCCGTVTSRPVSQINVDKPLQNHWTYTHCTLATVVSPPLCSWGWLVDAEL